MGVYIKIIRYFIESESHLDYTKFSYELRSRCTYHERQRETV